MMESAANIPYPNLRRASRTLELAYPEADVELREELAYLVSARRRTIQDALNYLADKSNVIRSSRTASPEPQPQSQQQDKLVPVPSSVGVTTREHENSSSHERQFLSLPSPNKYKYHDNINNHTNNDTINNTNSKKSDHVKYTLPSHSQSQENMPCTTFSFPHHNLKNNETHKNNGYTLHQNVFKLPRDCAPSQNHIYSGNNNKNSSSVYKKYEGKNVNFNMSDNTTDNEHVLPPIASKGKEMLGNESHNSSTSKNNSVIFPNIQSHSNGTRSSQHHMYTNIINNVSSSNNNKYHYVYGDNAEKFEEEIIGQGGQVILYVTSMTGEQRVRDHCRALETLLYLKEIPYHIVDIADNALLQRRIRLIYERATHHKITPHMPQLCVDDTLIGDYEQVQEKEDNNYFIDALREAGAKDLPSHIVLSKVESSNNMSNESKGITASLTNRKEKSKVNNNNNSSSSSITRKSKEIMEKKAINQMCNGIGKTTFIKQSDSNIDAEVSNANTQINEYEKNNDDISNLEKIKNKIEVADFASSEVNKIGNSDNSNDNGNAHINKTISITTSKKNNAKNTTSNVIVVSNGVDNIQGDNNRNNTHNECNRKESTDSITPLPSASSFVAPPASILIKRSSFTISTPNNSASTSAFLKHAVVKNNNTGNNNTSNNSSISNNSTANNKPNSWEITRPVNTLTRVATQLSATTTTSSTPSSFSSLLPQIK